MMACPRLAHTGVLGWCVGTDDIGTQDTGIRGHISVPLVCTGVPAAQQQRCGDMGTLGYGDTRTR